MSDEAAEAPEATWQRTRALAGGLWFPLFFFVGFMLCYMLPFHAPQPHDVKVAVSAPAVAGQLADSFGEKAPGAFEIVPAADPAAAKQAVLDRDAVAAFALDDGRATLYEAKAEGLSLGTVVTPAFTEVADQLHADLKVVDVAPLADGDGTGTGLFYLAMAWNIVPYILVMMLLQVVTLDRRGKLLTLAGVGAFVSIVGYGAGLALDIIPNEPLTLLYAFLLTQSVAWVTYGLVPFAKKFIPGVAMGLFVLLSIPSSGGAIPYQMVPAFFRFLHPVMPLGNAIDAFRSIMYFDSTALLRPTLVLLAWMAAGAALIGYVALKQRRAEREAASTETGTTEETVADPVLETPVDLTPTLSGRPVLSGRVADEHHRPVPGALITVLGADSRRLAFTRTDASGRYEAGPLPTESVTVLLSARGRSPSAVRLLPRAGQHVRQDFVLASAAEAVPVG